MLHRRQNFLIPQLNVQANDAELRNLQHKVLFDHYASQINKKQLEHRRTKSLKNIQKYQNPEIQSLYANGYAESNRQKQQVVREELARTYQEQIQRKQRQKKQQKNQQKVYEEELIQKGKMLEQYDRIKNRQLAQQFKNQAIQIVNDKQRRKAQQKRREQQQKMLYQQRYNTNLLSLNKQMSFKEHYSNVNGALAENERAYLSMVVPMNKYKEKEKDYIVQRGIKQNQNRMRRQLQREYQVANKYREDLRDSLAQQIRQKQQRKRRDLAATRAQGYTTNRYQRVHHPINNPIDFKITHDNKYIINQLQSKLARSGSHSLL